MGRTARSADASFRTLGHLPGTTLIFARDVSADGTVVIGSAGNDGEVGPRAFRWTSSGGMVALDGFSAANALSGDGSVVVGNVYDAQNATIHAVRWTPTTGVLRLGELPVTDPFGASFSNARGVSADGSIVVGAGRNEFDPVIARWDGGHVSSLGSLYAGNQYEPAAVAVTTDGSVIAGYSHSLRGDYEAVRWTRADGFVGLGDLPGGAFRSVAFAMSADGSVIVGDSESTPGRSEAFRWTAQDGMVGLGHLPTGVSGGDLDESQAFDVSADGSVVVGTSRRVFNETAFIWTLAGGMRSLADELTQHGVDTTGWRFTTAWGISADGRTIVGDAISPAGTREGYVAVLPEPGAFGIAAIAGLAALARRRHVAHH